MSGIEDELLALAGDDTKDIKPKVRYSPPLNGKRASTNGYADMKPNIKRKRSSSIGSDMDLSSGNESPSRPTKKAIRSNGNGKMKRSDSSEREDGEMEDPENPYPLEGVYKNSQDKARIQGMSELERENILHQRAEEMQKITDRRTLARMVQERDEGAESSYSSVKRKHQATGATEGKSRLLDDLKKKREAKNQKANNKSGRSPSPVPHYLDQDASEEEEGEIDIFTQRITEREKAKRAQMPDENDLKPCMITRQDLARKCGSDRFSDAVVGVFVRLAVGPDGKGENVYRICEIAEVLKRDQSYKVENFDTTSVLKLRHGDAHRDWTMDCISNSPFTMQEFERWMKSFNTTVRPPTKKDLAKRAKGLQKYLKETTLEQDYNTMLNKKQGFVERNKKGAALRVTLQTQLEIAQSEGNMEKVEAIRAELKTLTENKPIDATAEKMRKLNEKNRQANWEAIRRREAEAAENRKKGIVKEVKYDPSARVKTQARFLYDTSGRSTPQSTPSTPLHESVKAVTPTPPTSQPKPVQPVMKFSQMAASVTVDLDF